MLHGCCGEKSRCRNTSAGNCSMSAALSPNNWGRCVHARRHGTKRGKSAECEQSSRQQLHIDIAGLETCGGQNVHQGMGDGHTEPTEIQPGMTFSEKTNRRHSRDFSTTSINSMPIQGRAHAATSPHSHGSSAAARRHSPHMRRIDATVTHISWLKWFSGQVVLLNYSV